MTASTVSRSDLRPAGRAGASPFLGFRAFFRKEVAEWARGRRAVVLFITTSAMMGLTTLSPWLAAWSARVSQVKLAVQPPMDPTINVLARWDQWVFMFAIFASLSLVVGERDRGTLAWSLSKPLSRSGLLLAKWSAGVAMFWVFGIALPMLVSVAVAIVAYGMPDLVAVGIGTILLATVPAFFIALALTLGIVLPGQAGVGAVGLIAALVPGIVGTIAPTVAAVLPPSIGPWAIGVALNAPVPLSTPMGWVVGMVAVAAIGLRAIQRADF